MKILSEYMFDVIIENVFVEDYVSEKLYQALISGAVPVYKGAPNARQFVPCDDCVIWVDEHVTAGGDVAPLIARLRAVASNRTAYAAYHAWRRRALPARSEDILHRSLDNATCRFIAAAHSN